MKRYYILLTIVVIACALSIVWAINYVDKNKGKTRYLQDEYYEIVIDKETGVNYIINSSDNNQGITVRLHADGKPYVSEVE